jgi:hypothetical protein
VKGCGIMAILWFDEKNKGLIATIATANITLNKTAKNLIEYAYSVMLGINKEEHKAYIKALNKETVERGNIPQTQLYTVTLRQSYGRISNKEYIKRISEITGKDYTSPVKYIMTYDHDEHMLIIDLNREV